MADENELIRRGIATARDGDRETARGLLLEATLLNPNSENAWLWLAKITDSPQGKISYLKRALTVNPTREATQVALKGAQMQEAIAQAKAGNKEVSRRLLLSVTDADPACQPAWLWLASVAASTEDAKRYLERAVELDPANQNATAWLERLRRESPSPVFAPPPKPPISREAFDKPPGRETPPSETSASARAGERAESKSPESGGASPVVEPAAPPLNLGVPAVAPGRDGISGAFAAQTPPTGEQPPVPARGVVLAVDDSLIIRRAVATTLEREGFRVVSAEDGMKALSLLNEVSPDVILLDIAMPMMDGYEVCKLVRKNAAFKHVPVVMLSGKDGFFDKVKGKLAGSTEYLTKPFEPEKLIKTVDKHCQRQRRMGGASPDQSIYGFAR
jgi:twitching motility two-component system response regulator PilG